MQLSDLQLRTAIRDRLRYDHPAFEPGMFQATIPSTHCHKRYAPSRERPGGVCGKVLDATGTHAVHCNVGGGVDDGHNAIRDWLAKLLERWSGRPTLTEQWVPAWDEAVPVKNEDGTPVLEADGRPVMEFERARLDVQFYDRTGQLQYVDVMVASVQSVNAARVRRFAAKPGVAADLGEQEKRRRYRAARNPHAAMVPFVVEALGRPGPSAVQLLRAMAPQDPTTRGTELRRAYAELSTLVQIRRANLLIAAEYTHDAPGGSSVGGRRPQSDEDARALRRQLMNADYVDTTRSSIQIGGGAAAAKIQ